MIEILKHGNKIIKTCCDTCGCEFSFHKDADVGKETPRYVRCPECGCYTLWDENETF